MKFRFILGMLCIIALPAYAEKENRLEIGAIFAAQSLQEYRGSDTTELNAIVAPFIFYQGDFLKIDRGGVRAELFNSNRVEFKLSGDAALGGGENDTEAREGMPDIDPTFEIGPSLNFNLTGKDFRQGWQFDLPLRAVFSFEGFDATHRGFTFNPRFTYNFKPFFNGWVAKTQIGALYGSEDYHEYFYDVQQEFVTDTRPFFESSAGFSGSYFRATLRKRTKSFLYGFSFRYDNLSGAVIEDSPLVETKDYFAIGFAFAYIFWSPSI